jgi:agmatine deiminase
MPGDAALKSPFSMGFRQPAEWEKHDACWLAWPSHADLWLEALAPVQNAFVAFARAICDLDPVSGKPRGESLEILVPNAEREAEARSRLRGLPCRFHLIPFGDIWLRDTAPIFVTTAESAVSPVSFGFNGWGGKWILPHDAEVSAAITAASGLPSFRFDWVLEGGSVDPDGEGTMLTTRQCLLNPNRNPGLSQAEIEAGLRESLGVETLLWLGDGLLNDHTDGHVDTVARFVAPGVVVCMEPVPGDPNREALENIIKDLGTMRDAKGRRLEVVTVPSPGEVLDEDGELMPASYVNFYIANTTVTVPVYGAKNDDASVAAIARLFPSRRTTGVFAKDILEGGGAFHCISQQQPAGAGR